MKTLKFLFMIPLVLLACNVAFLANAIDLSNGNFRDTLIFIMLTFILQIVFVLATWTQIKRIKNNESRDEFTKFVLSLQEKGEQTKPIRSKRKRSSKSIKARSQKVDR